MVQFMEVAKRAIATMWTFQMWSTLYTQSSNGSSINSLFSRLETDVRKKADK